MSRYSSPAATNRAWSLSSRATRAARRSESTSVVSKTTVSRPSAAGTSAAVAAVKRGRARPAGLAAYAASASRHQSASRNAWRVAATAPMFEVGYSFSSRPRIATIWPFEGSSTRPDSGPSARLTTVPWPRRTPVAGTAATTANPCRRSASATSSRTSSLSMARVSACTAFTGWAAGPVAAAEGAGAGVAGPEVSSSDGRFGPRPASRSTVT